MHYIVVSTTTRKKAKEMSGNENADERRMFVGQQIQLVHENKDQLKIQKHGLILEQPFDKIDFIQGVPDQIFQFERGFTLNLCMLDPNLVKPKLV